MSPKRKHNNPENFDLDQSLRVWMGGGGGGGGGGSGIHYSLKI